MTPNAHNTTPEGRKFVRAIVARWKSGDLSDFMAFYALANYFDMPALTEADHQWARRTASRLGLDHLLINDDDPNP